MTKKELFKRIVEPSILTGLVGAYNLNVSALSESQQRLVDIATDDMYESIGNRLTLKDLQDRFGELFGRKE